MNCFIIKMFPDVPEHVEIQYIKGLRVCVVVFFRCIHYRFIDEQTVGLSCEGDDPGDQR